MKNVTTIDMKNLLYLVPSRFERKVDFPQCQFLEVRVKKDMQDVGALLNLNMVIFQLGQHTNTIVEKCKNRLTKIQSKRFCICASNLSTDKRICCDRVLHRN